MASRKRGGGSLAGLADASPAGTIAGRICNANFAIQHPPAVASGERAYTFDCYGPELKQSGKTLQTHYTYAFFVVKPSYDVVRKRILAIAAAKASPLSGRTGPVDYRPHLFSGLHLSYAHGRI